MPLPTDRNGGRRGVDLSEKVVPTRRKTVNERTGLKADTAVDCLGRNDKTVARTDFKLLIRNREAETTLLHEGGLNMGVRVRAPSAPSS